jgi:uncharacterized protein (DUF1015 family)
MHTEATMTIIKPFAGFRYDAKRAGELVDLIAPPYDIINAELRQTLFDRSPFNVIRLIKSEPEAGDNERQNRYTRAAGFWRDWRRQGMLRRDDPPRLYRYNVSFNLKTPQGIVTRERPGFVALLKLHEYAAQKVRPHERTLAGPKQDRLQLMLATRAHFSQVFMLYPDPKGKVDGLLGAAPPAGVESWTAEDDAGVTHTMWGIEDAKIIAAVNDHLEQTPIYIADGHHRYETALAVRRHLAQTSPLFAGGSDYMMCYFTPAEHPGLTIFPYHRIIHHLPKRRLSGMLKKLETSFRVERALVSPFSPGNARREFMAGLLERGGRGPSFALVDGAAGEAWYLTLKPDAQLHRECRTEAEVVLCGLDVVILEDLILSDLLGIKHKDLLNEKHVSYETDYDRVLDGVQQPPNQLGFLMNPTPVGKVLAVADLAGVMPEKSTYFFPKVATGLVMNSFEE